VVATGVRESGLANLNAERVMLEDMATSRYLMNAYAVSSDSWENFRQTGQQASLYEVASALCGAWTLLADDDDFFDGVEEANSRLWSGPTRDPAAEDPVKYGREQDAFDALRDADRLLSKEFVVLVQAGMNPIHVTRLISDLSGVLTGPVEPLPPPSVSALRQDVPLLARELCTAQQALNVLGYGVESEPLAQHAPHRRWVKGLRLVGKALGATAAAAGAVGNVAGAVATFGVASGFALASVVASAQVLTVTLADSLEATRRVRGDDFEQA